MHANLTPFHFPVSVYSTVAVFLSPLLPPSTFSHSVRVSVCVLCLLLLPLLLLLLLTVKTHITCRLSRETEGKKQLLLRLLDRWRLQIFTALRAVHRHMSNLMTLSGFFVCFVFPRLNEIQHSLNELSGSSLFLMWIFSTQ